MKFIDSNTQSNIHQLSEAQLDSADYGIVKVDNEGKILFYNRYESDLAGVEKSRAQGANFFTEIAPCTNNRLFLGKFKQGVESGNLDSAFNYTFTYKMQPTNVVIHLLHKEEDKSNWILVKKAA